MLVLLEGKSRISCKFLQAREIADAQSDLPVFSGWLEPQKVRENSARRVDINSLGC
jgi:hypothetical protein